MPMKRGQNSAVCHYGHCGKAAKHHHHFKIDLHDGKPLITVRACSEEHAIELKKHLAEFLPK